MDENRRRKIEDHLRSVAEEVYRDFVRRAEDALAQCDVLLAEIGEAERGLALAQARMQRAAGKKSIH